MTKQVQNSDAVEKGEARKLSKAEVQKRAVEAIQLEDNRAPIAERQALIDRINDDLSLEIEKRQASWGLTEVEEDVMLRLIRAEIPPKNERVRKNDGEGNPLPIACEIAREKLEPARRKFLEAMEQYIAQRNLGMVIDVADEAQDKHGGDAFGRAESVGNAALENAVHFYNPEAKSTREGFEGRKARFGTYARWAVQRSVDAEFTPGRGDRSRSLRETDYTSDKGFSLILGRQDEYALKAVNKLRAESQEEQELKELTHALINADVPGMTPRRRLVVKLRRLYDGYSAKRIADMLPCADDAEKWPCQGRETVSYARVQQIEDKGVKVLSGFIEDLVWARRMNDTSLPKPRNEWRVDLGLLREGLARIAGVVDPRKAESADIGSLYNLEDQDVVLFLQLGLCPEHPLSAQVMGSGVKQRDLEDRIRENGLMPDNIHLPESQSKLLGKEDKT